MQGLPKTGDVLDGTYRIEELIGKGGFGAVYRATQLSMEREVALKILVAHALKVDEMIARFRREVMAVRNLGHPNTIRIYDFRDRADGLLYYAMEFVRGPTLKDTIDDGGPMSPRRVAHVLRQTLKSLSEAHSYGIVHRDLKPANIMLADIAGENDFVKVLDFGIAKIIGGDDEEERDQLTNAGVLVGTLNYMSPEQIAGGDIGPSSDLYALGLIGIEMLTGRSVFAGTGRWEILHKQISDEPVDIPEEVTTSELGPLLRKALHKRQAERFARAEEMLEALEQLPSLSDTPLLGPDEIPDGPTRRVTVESEASDDDQSVEDDATQAAEIADVGPPLSTQHSEPAPLQINPSTIPDASTQPVERVRPKVRIPAQTGEEPSSAPQRTQHRSDQTEAVGHASPPPGQTAPHALGDDREGNAGLIAVAAITFVGIIVCAAILFVVLGDSTADPETPEQPVAAASAAPEEEPEPEPPSEIKITQLQTAQPNPKTIRLVTPDLEASVYRDGKLWTTPIDVKAETTYTVRAEGYRDETVELAKSTNDVFDLRLRRVRAKADQTKDAPPEAPIAEKAEEDNGWVDVPVETKKNQQQKPEKKVEVPIF